MYKAGIAEFVVHRYINRDPYLKQYKDDLLQEATLAQLQGERDYIPGKGMDKDLFITYRCSYAIHEFVRSEVKQFAFKQPEADDPESAYWPDKDFVDSDTTVIQEQGAAEERFTPQFMLPDHRQEVWEVITGIKFSENQRIVLESFLETGSHTKSRKILGVSKPRITGIWQRVLQKIREANDLETP